jgi:tetratricopeptide (TPR) repeat protein
MKRGRILALVAAAIIHVPSSALGGPGVHDDGPVVAGPMSDEATRGARLFEARRWAEAALVESSVARGETGDDPGNRQIARYHLAVALHHLGLLQASLAVFSGIADRPRDLGFDETLFWLAQLATELPEPADVIERVGKYGPAKIARFDSPGQRDLHGRLNYLLGRHKYRSHSYEEAIGLFEKVDRRSAQWIPGQFYMGLAYVQLRKTVPAVKAFQRLAGALDDDGSLPSDPERARLRDLAFLSMARAYYSSSLAGLYGGATIDTNRLSAAVKYWNRVEPGGLSWADALFESSWAYFMAGDYPRALGNIHALTSPYFPGDAYPEAEILRAIISFTLCQYEDVITLVARMMKRYEPIRGALAALLDRLDGEGPPKHVFRLLEDVRAGRASLPPVVRAVVQRALSDRELLRHLAYVRDIDEESARFAAMPAAFHASRLGGEIADTLELARDLAVHDGGALARSRLQRALDELDRHLLDARKLVVDVTVARLGETSAERRSRELPADEPIRYGAVRPDNEHVNWPFDGEFWRDELGSYRQVVTSRCGSR